MLAKKPLLERRSRLVVERVLDWMLHLRCEYFPQGGLGRCCGTIETVRFTMFCCAVCIWNRRPRTEPYRWATLSTKILDESIVRDMSFNERVMCTFLDAGWVGACVRHGIARSLAVCDPFCVCRLSGVASFVSGVAPYSLRIIGT